MVFKIESLEMITLLLVEGQHLVATCHLQRFCMLRHSQALLEHVSAHQQPN